jgi:hypothetical protein
MTLLLHPAAAAIAAVAANAAAHRLCTGFRKVILATNIAESSITFDDVVAVVDSCRVNLAAFDAVNNLPTVGPQVRASTNTFCTLGCPLFVWRQACWLCVLLTLCLRQPKPRHARC